MSTCHLFARITTNKPCDLPLAHRLLLVAAALVSVTLGAALPVSAESVLAKEKPLYVGDFGPRYVLSHGEFLLPNDSRVQWTIRSLQSPGADLSTSQTICRSGVRSYRSYDDLNRPRRFLNSKRGYEPRSILPSSFLNGARVEPSYVGDFRPRPSRASSVRQPARSMLFQSLDSLKAAPQFSPQSDTNLEHGDKTPKGAANATRFKFDPNVWKTEHTPASSR
jgi:hypothetical protein